MLFIDKLLTEDLVEWIDVAPLIYHLHELQYDPYVMRWPYVAWSLIYEYDDSYPQSRESRLHSALLATWLVRFHSEALGAMQYIYHEDDWPAVLESILTTDHLYEFLESRFQSHMAEGVEDLGHVFDVVYRMLLPGILEPLYYNLGSVSDVCHSIWEVSPLYAEELSIAQLAGAQIFIMNAYVGLNMTDSGEFVDCPTDWRWQPEPVPEGIIEHL